MKDYISDDEETEKMDLFDPFWMLFADEEDNSDIERATAARKPVCRKQQRNGHKDHERSGMFDYFIALADDELLTGRTEEREPRQQTKRLQRQYRQKNQHQWRRNQPKKEREHKLSFGRISNSKSPITPSNQSVEFSLLSEERAVPQQSFESEQRTADSNSNENSAPLYPGKTLPRFMEGFTTKWHLWGEQDSSSESSVASYPSESSHPDGSMASGSFASRRFGPQERQKVQQILVQFNPGGGLHGEKAETASSEQTELGNMMKSLKPTDCVEENSTTQNESHPAVAFAPDEITVSSCDKSERIEQLFRPRVEFDVHDDSQPCNKCLDLNKMCALRTKKERRSRIPFVRSKASGLVDQNDLYTVFPKLRMVADEKDPGAKTFAVVANSKNFKGNIPTHLLLSSEAFLATKGPQSLYEYEYDGGEHIDVAYNHFGPNPLSLLVIRHHLTPPRPQHLGAIVQVEASTISMTDCSMRSGEWMGKDTPPLPITPGVDMVGKIFRIDKENSGMLDLCVGDRVISLTRCGGNSRFLAIDPWHLVKITADVDPAEAACLAEAYLSAFQVLHLGQSGGVRYKNNALRGKSILLMGTVTTTLGKAIVELASVAGVSKIIATSAPKHYPQLRSLGIIPVSLDPALWYDHLNGGIDLLLVFNADVEVVAEHFKVLNDRGHLIVIGQRMGSGVPIGDYDYQINTKTLICKRQKVKVSMIDRTHDYNPFRQWDHDLQNCKRDLSHLVKLLETGDIKPNVLDRIPLNKVAKAQDMVESQRHPGGFLVCEPWLRNKKRAVRL